MSSKIWLPLMIFLMLLTGCNGQGPAVATVPATPATPMPEEPVSTPVMPGTGSEEQPINPYAPGKGDESMKRGEVYIDSREVQTLETFPPQFRLHVEGNLPTPCHELRAVVGEPDTQNQIQVEMYSLVDPNTICAQVLEAFEADIPLGGYASGTYMIFVNGEQVGEITP